MPHLEPIILLPSFIAYFQVVIYSLKAAGSWLTGTHIGTWVTEKLSEKEKEERENLSINWTYMLNKSLDNLHKSLWIGLLEQPEQSMEMLRYQTGLSLKFGHRNKNSDYPEPTQEEIMKLKQLMPLDLYIYEYVKQLFDQRWRAYLKERSKKQFKELRVNGNAVTTLSLPDTIHGCVSTRRIILCPSDNS